jgi:hypothetical protein
MKKDGHLPHPLEPHSAGASAPRVRTAPRGARTASGISRNGRNTSA